MEEKNKYNRSVNFTEEEKKVVVQYVLMHSDLMENKSSDVTLYKRKRQGWQEISDNLKTLGFDRDPKVIRDLYHRLKTQARKSIISYKAEQLKEGGEVKRCKSPSELDWQIYQICPGDFVINPGLDLKTRNLQATPCKSPEMEIISAKMEIMENEIYLPVITPENEQQEANIAIPIVDDNIAPKSPPTIPSPKTTKKSESKKKQMSNYESELLKLYAKESELKVKHLKEAHEIQMKIQEKEHKKQMQMQEEQLVLLELKKEKQRLKILKLKKELNLD